MPMLALIFTRKFPPDDHRLGFRMVDVRRMMARPERPRRERIRA